MWTLLEVVALAIGNGANVCARQESGKARSQIIHWISLWIVRFGVKIALASAKKLGSH